MTSTPGFEDRLLRELLAVVAERPAPAPRREPRRAQFALAGAGVVTAVAAVAIATSSDVTTSAYAVQSRPDGTVTVQIRSLRDANGLQTSLRAAGVPAVVDYAAAGGAAGCVGLPSGGPAGGHRAAGTTSGTDRKDGPSISGSTGPHSGTTASAPGPGTSAASAGRGGTVSASGPGAPAGPTGRGDTTTASGPGAPAGPTGRGGATTAGGRDGGAVSGSVRVDTSGVTFSIDPGHIRPGEHVYITTTTGALTSVGIAIAGGPPSAACATAP